MAREMPTQAAQARHFVMTAFAHQRESCKDDENFVVNIGSMVNRLLCVDGF